METEKIPIIRIKKDDGTFVEAILLEDLDNLMKLNESKREARYIG